MVAHREPARSITAKLPPRCATDPLESAVSRKFRATSTRFPRSHLHAEAVFRHPAPLLAIRSSSAVSMQRSPAHLVCPATKSPIGFPNDDSVSRTHPLLWFPKFARASLRNGPNFGFTRISSSSRNSSLRSISRPKSRRRYRHRKLLCDDSILNQFRAEFPRAPNQLQSYSVRPGSIRPSHPPSSCSGCPVRSMFGSIRHPPTRVFVRERSSDHPRRSDARCRARDRFGHIRRRTRPQFPARSRRTPFPARAPRRRFSACEGSPTVTAREPPRTVARAPKLARIGCVRTVDEYSSRRLPAGLSASLRTPGCPDACFDAASSPIGAAQLPTHRPTVDAVLDCALHAVTCAATIANTIPRSFFPAEHPRSRWRSPAFENSNVRAFVFRPPIAPNQSPPGCPRENRSESNVTRLSRQAAAFDSDSVARFEIDSHRPAFVFRLSPVSRTPSSPGSTSRSVARPLRRSEIDERRGRPSPKTISPTDHLVAQTTDEPALNVVRLPGRPTQRADSRSVSRTRIGRAERPQNRPGVGNKLSPTHHRGISSATTTNSSRGCPCDKPNDQLQTSFPVRESAAIEPAPKFPPRRAIWNQSHRVAPKGPIWDRIFAELPREKFDRNWLKRKVTQVSEPISSRFASRPVSRARNPSLRDPLAIRFPGRSGSGFSVVARSPEQRADRVASSQVAQR